MISTEPLLGPVIQGLEDFCHTRGQIQPRQWVATPNIYRADAVLFLPVIHKPGLMILDNLLQDQQINRRRLKNHQLPEAFTLDQVRIQDTVRKSNLALEVIRKWTRPPHIKGRIRMMAATQASSRITPRTWGRSEMSQRRGVEVGHPISHCTKTTRAASMLEQAIRLPSNKLEWVAQAIGKSEVGPIRMHLATSNRGVSMLMGRTVRAEMSHRQFRRFLDPQDQWMITVEITPRWWTVIMLATRHRRRIRIAISVKWIIKTRITQPDYWITLRLCLRVLVLRDRSTKQSLWKDRDHSNSEVRKAVMEVKVHSYLVQDCSSKCHS